MQYERVNSKSVPLSPLSVSLWFFYQIKKFRLNPFTFYTSKKIESKILVQFLKRVKHFFLHFFHIFNIILCLRDENTNLVSLKSKRHSAKNILNVNKHCNTINCWNTEKKTLTFCPLFLSNVSVRRLNQLFEISIFSPQF